MMVGGGADGGDAALDGVEAVDVIVGPGVDERGGHVVRAVEVPAQDDCSFGMEPACRVDASGPSELSWGVAANGQLAVGAFGGDEAAGSSPVATRPRYLRRM